MNEIKRATPRELLELAKKMPRFESISDVDVVMGDVFGKATIERKSLSSEIVMTITCSEYID